MVQISGLTSSECSIHYILVIQSEEIQIAESLTCLVHDFTLICHYVANELADIFSNDLASVDGLASEETIFVDS